MAPSKGLTEFSRSLQFIATHDKGFANELASAVYPEHLYIHGQNILNPRQLLYGRYERGCSQDALLFVLQRFASVPYYLLSKSYVVHLRELSHIHNHPFLHTAVVRPSQQSLSHYNSLDWRPHGFKSLTAYLFSRLITDSSSDANATAKHASRLLGLFLGYAARSSPFIIPFVATINNEVFEKSSISVAWEGALVPGGFIHEDVLDRVGKVCDSLMRTTKDSSWQSIDSTSLYIPEEPNLGHQYWNGFCGAYDVLERLPRLMSSNQQHIRSIAWHNQCNYFPSESLLKPFRCSRATWIKEGDIDRLESQYILPVDSPYPNFRTHAVLRDFSNHATRIEALDRQAISKKSYSKHVIFQIKGSSYKYSQVQLTVKRQIDLFLILSQRFSASNWKITIDGSVKPYSEFSCELAKASRIFQEKEEAMSNMMLNMIGISQGNRLASSSQSAVYSTFPEKHMRYTDAVDLCISLGAASALFIPLIYKIPTLYIFAYDGSYLLEDTILPRSPGFNPYAFKMLNIGDAEVGDAATMANKAIDDLFLLSRKTV